MRFAPNKFYVEQYDKCSNCGILLYEKNRAESRTVGGTLFCSKWCVDWFEARAQRLRAAAPDAKAG